MLVTGMTIPDITRAVSKRYDNVLNGGIAVSLNLVTTRENTAILGEVKKPGMYPLYEPRHPLYAIAMAGGELETANLSKIILLKRTPDRGLRQYKLDLKAKHVARARGASPALLEPEDILLVPKTGIANVNKWVQQYIRKLLPVSTSASATYNINNAE
jgi:protein involved in polysaccharide export with SLBB domain